MPPFDLRLEASMTDKPKLGELKDRLRKARNHFGGDLPKEVAAAWSGYFAALIEWGLISIEDHRRLVEMLPEAKRDEDPVMGILLGYGEEPNEIAGEAADRSDYRPSDGLEGSL